MNSLGAEMECRNCGQGIGTHDDYCGHCGAVVVTERLTTRRLWKDLTKNAFGWDNKYFLTVRKLIAKPDVLIKEHLSGVRKRYTPPFAFFTIGMALSLLLFNLFVDDFVAMSTPMNEGPCP